MLPTGPIPSLQSIPVPTQGSMAMPAQVGLSVPVETAVPMPTGIPIAMRTAVPAPAQTSICLPVQTSIRVPVQTSIPVPVQTSIPVPVQRSIPVPVQAAVPVPVQAAVPVPVQAAVPVPVQLAQPVPVETLPPQEQMYEVEKPPDNEGVRPAIHAWLTRWATPKLVMLVGGTVMIALLWLNPYWNAIGLLHDQNFVFWVGRAIPRVMISMAVVILVVYIFTMFIFFYYATPQFQTDQTLVSIVGMFVTLTGLVLLLCSIPLIEQTTFTYTNLMFQCDTSIQTQRLFEYSQVLNNIRSQPDCAALRSVEECAGYKEAPPYTTILKVMEDTMFCSGFCLKNWVPTNTTTYPPTLFSKANHQGSCEGMAARDIKNFAGSIGLDTKVLGVFYVFTAIFLGLFNLLDYCMPTNKAASKAGDLNAGLLPPNQYQYPPQVQYSSFGPPMQVTA